MNALFGLHLQISVGECLIVGIAVSTQCLLSLLLVTSLYVCITVINPNSLSQGRGGGYEMCDVATCCTKAHEASEGDTINRGGIN